MEPPGLQRYLPRLLARWASGPDRSPGVARRGEAAGMSASPYTSRQPIAPPATEFESKEQLCLWGATLEDAFNRYHAENPHVYRLLLAFTREVKAAGHEHYSIDAIFQRARWHTDVETQDPDGFKLNDHHRAYYARLINQEPGMEGFFRTRERKKEAA